ncbi:hypothetical protein JRC19_29910, partial [Escherichia coli]|nr:hypothetical protein [Escherichia coli]
IRHPAGFFYRAVEKRLLFCGQARLRIVMQLFPVRLALEQVALGVAGLWSAWVLVPLAIILVPFNFAPMRKSMISAPVFRGFR